MICEIAGIMLHKPEILFLDEPTIGLDIINKERILSAIQHLNSQYNTTIFFTTHDMDDVERICKRIIVIDDGCKMYDGSIDAFISKHTTQKTISLALTSNAPIGNMIELQKIASCAYAEGKVSISFDESKISSVDMIYLCMQSIKNIKQITTQEKSLEDVLKGVYKGGISK